MSIFLPTVVLGSLQATKWVLKHCFHFLNKSIIPVACFAAGHNKTDLGTMDLHFRRLLRSAVGPPSQAESMAIPRDMFRGLALWRARSESINNIRILAKLFVQSIRLHVVTKNLQSIRTEARFNDFLVDIVSCDFDALFVSETWRNAKQESYTTIRGAGCTSVDLLIKVLGRHAYSPRICVLKYSLGMLNLELFALYFPTSWDDIIEVEGTYTLLQVLVANYVSRGACPILGGDFNAYIGPVSKSDDVDLVGCLGFGERNAQGMLLTEWVIQNGVYIANRQNPTYQIEDSWTCRRSSDGILIQIDVIILDRPAVFDNSWNDYIIPIGLDHCWVHCTLHFSTPRVLNGKQRYKKLRIGNVLWMRVDVPQNISMKYNGGLWRFITSRASLSELGQTLLDGRHVVTNAPGVLWHFGLRMNLRGSDCNGFWHKPAGNFGGCHCRFGH